MNSSAPQALLRFMQRTCDLAIDLDDAKEMIHQQFEFLRTGRIYNDRPTTHRAILELLSKSNGCSVEEVKVRWPQERLEEIRKKSPSWSRDFDLFDLFCDQKKSSEFQRFEPDPTTTLRALFVDGTEDSLDVQDVPPDTLARLVKSEFTEKTTTKPATDIDKDHDHLNFLPSRVVLEKLQDWLSWPRRRVEQIVSLFDDELVLEFVKDPIKFKRSILASMCDAACRGISLSPRDIFNSICDAASGSDS